MECARARPNDRSGASTTTPGCHCRDGGGTSATVPGRNRQANDRRFSQRSLDSAGQHHDAGADGLPDGVCAALAPVHGERPTALAAARYDICAVRAQEAGGKNPCADSGAACAGSAEGG